MASPGGGGKGPCPQTHYKLVKYVPPDGFLWHSDFRTSYFGRGLRWVSLLRSPDLLVGCGGGYQLPILHPVDAFGLGVLALCLWHREMDTGGAP